MPTAQSRNLSTRWGSTTFIAYANRTVRQGGYPVRSLYLKDARTGTLIQLKERQARELRDQLAGLLGKEGPETGQRTH